MVECTYCVHTCFYIVLIFKKCIHLYINYFNYIYNSAIKRLIMINRIQNKGFCLHNMCVYCVYLLCIYKYIHMHVYI